MHSAQIAVIGVSYRTAPIALRERLSCSLPDHAAARQDHDGRFALGRFAAVREWALLSTCNRVELFAALDASAGDGRTLLADLLAALTGVETAVFADHLYFHAGQAAATHLCRVAAGLDSLVLGEPQILGQVTDAFMAATAAKQIGPALTALFRTAIRAGKRARTETAISENPVSTSAIAVAQAQAVLGSLTPRTHLIVGLGEMGQLALKALRARGVRRIALANRSRARAEALAAAEGLTVYGLDELETAVAAADVVISATAAHEPVLTTEMVQRVMAGRAERPLVLIDIAVPRDVEAAVRRIPNVYLFDADELQDSLDEALAARQQEIPQIETIIAAEVEAFMTRLRQMAVKPLITDLRHKAEEIRQQELNRTLRYLGDVDADTLKHIQHLSRSLVNKLLHEPTIRLRHKAAEEEADVYADAVRDLFGLQLPDDLN